MNKYRPHSKLNVKKVVVFVVIIFLIGLLINIAIWGVVCHRQIERNLEPGETYTVGNRIYKFSTRRAKGVPYVLKQSLLVTLRELLVKITTAFEQMGIDYWIAGGTLIGFFRDGTMLPWDDDIDIHTTWDQRYLLTSRKFSDVLRTLKLEQIDIFWAGDISHRDKISSGIRVRHENTLYPVCDIFFEAEVEAGKYGKIDSWDKHKINFNTKEIWQTSYIFPTQRVVVDGITLKMPKNPQKVLEIQYGPRVMYESVVRNYWISHAYPFIFIPWVWKKV